MTIAPRNQKGTPSGRAVVRTGSGDFNEVIGGFAAFNAFMSLMHKIV